MAQHLTRFLIAMGMAASLLAVPCAAEVLPDPTRPADDQGVAQGSAPGAGGEPVPQLVRISRDRKSAIIGGQNVRVGDTYGGAKVVKITETEVVLKSGDAYQTLKMFPGVEKTPSKRKAKK